ncbi:MULTISPECIES: hypothetical protein [Halorubrum]|uniref:Uncharacterized protein n=1 Tax=Halorubrum sodomense TaxID=35743 RepID=A0A1I6FQ75_HALSD|nr:MULTISPECIES: hypothetical protein [Halorubrum]TKX53243.1 hypothetical protein EXE42_13750 [Halorubrum sp. SP3]TKX70361.1 hypothetical protein EXE45_04455 [Halorubrum sp. SP9]SFR32093.1 hypothetical protein SAMN04487937_1023 [Halorubrum sodomense]
MDAPETEGGERETERAETLPEGTPLAFADRDPAALDDATELYLLDRHAVGDGTVRVQLIDWERDGDVVLVAYALPTGERRHDRYRWPTAGRYDESDFLALVRGLGYPPAAADLVAGEFARARSENGRWRIVTGRRPGPVEGNGADAGSTRTERGRSDGDTARGAARRETVSGLRSRVRRVDPMATGIVAVTLFVLAVGLPASLATVTGGISAALTALGGALFVGALAALGLSIAVAP